MTTYPHNAKLHRTTPDLTIATFTYKRQSGSKHILEDSNSVTVSVSEQQLGAYNLSRRMVLAELEETLRRKIDRVHEELREAGIAYNPMQPANICFITHGGNTVKEVHRYDPKSGRYIESYPSFTYAAQANGGTAKSGSNITRVCKGVRPLAYGFKWSYEKRNFY